MVAKFFWVISLLCALGGGFIGFMEFISAKSAPQEAAAAAFGCLMAIAPYVVARSVQELSTSTSAAPVATRVSAEPINRRVLIGLAVLAAIVAAIPAYNWLAPQLTPSSDYSVFQDQQIDWHRRCDAFMDKAVAEQDRAKAESCQQEGDRLLANAKSKGWR